MPPIRLTLIDETAYVFNADGIYTLELIKCDSFIELFV